MFFLEHYLLLFVKHLAMSVVTRPYLVRQQYTDVRDRVSVCLRQVHIDRQNIKLRAYRFQAMHQQRDPTA